MTKRWKDKPIERQTNGNTNRLKERCSIRFLNWCQLDRDNLSDKKTDERKLNRSSRMFFEEAWIPARSPILAIKLI